MSTAFWSSHLCTLRYWCLILLFPLSRYSSTKACPVPFALCTLVFALFQGGLDIIMYVSLQPIFFPKLPPGYHWQLAILVFIKKINRWNLRDWRHHCLFKTRKFWWIKRTFSSVEKKITMLRVRGWKLHGLITNGAAAARVYSEWVRFLLALVQWWNGYFCGNTKPSRPEATTVDLQETSMRGSRNKDSTLRTMVSPEIWQSAEQNVQTNHSRNEEVADYIIGSEAAIAPFRFYLEYIRYSSWWISKNA